jgi:hypothetical protein
MMGGIAFIVQQDELFLVNRALLLALATRRRTPGMFVVSAARR